MVRDLLTSNSPLVNVMIPLTENTIVSPAAAPTITCRREPAPLSAVVVTVLVAGIPEKGNRANVNNKKYRAFLIIKRARTKVGKNQQIPTNHTNGLHDFSVAEMRKGKPE